jgi:23S rRNA pseudouridine1911/1915/1917 synthase
MQKPFKAKKLKETQSDFPVTEPRELMQFLTISLPDKNRTKIKSMLAHRQVSVDNSVVTKFDFPLKAGQTVSLNSGYAAQTVKYNGLNIVFEDQHIVVVEKMPGILSVATDKQNDHTAYRILSTHVKEEDPKNRIFVVHRLDREASGIMLFAKSANVQETLQKEWQESVIERSYIAVVEGSMEKDEDTIISNLTESKAFVMYSTRVPGEGQRSVTHYKVLQKNDDYSMLEVKLETGRKNQIRVHLKDIGHPIIGDKKYGSTINPIYRVALHARVIRFIHPVTRKEMFFESRTPFKFVKLFEGTR